MENIQALRDKHEELTLEAENAALEHEVSLLKAASRSVAAAEIAETRASLVEQGTVIGANNGYLFDSPGFGFQQRNGLTGEFTHHSQLDDRMDGRNRPFWENETELAEIRGTCRVLVGVDEAAIGIAGNLTNYVVGTGFKYSVAPRDKDDATSVAASELTTEVIEEFQQRVRWRRIERELHDRSRRDGEHLLQIDDIGGGYADVFFREPDALVEPHDKRATTDMLGQFAVDWTFGVATDIGNPNRVHGYFFDNTGDQQDWDVVRPRNLVHGKRNVDRVIKRGLSDYYPVWQELSRSAKVLRNTGEGAALQAAIAWIKEHVSGTTRSQVQSLNSSSRDFQLNKPTLEGTNKPTNFQQYLPGTILHVPAGTQYKPGPMGAERDTNFVMVSDAIIRYAGLRWCMPAFMTNGSSDSKTFAGNLVAESPFVKCAESEQIWFVEEYSEVFWKILQIAIRTRRFRELGIQRIQDLMRLVSLNIKPPRVSSRNRKEELEANLLLYERRLVSGRSTTSLAEFDYDHEQELIAEEPEPVNIAQTDVATRPDIESGEQQQPVNDVGTGTTTESVLVRALRESFMRTRFLNYP